MRRDARLCPGPLFSSTPPRFEPLEPRTLCAADLTTSLVAHWSFEDLGNAPAQFADVSPHGDNHPATPAGDPVLLKQHRANHVLQLDGNGDRLTVANSSDINLGTQAKRSIAFWFRVDDATLDTRKQLIFEEGGTTRGLNLYVFDGRAYVGGWNKPSGESNWAGTWLSTAGVQSGRWHHLALTLDGGATTADDALRGYLDGQLFAQGVGSQLWSHSGSNTIGDHTDGTIFHDATGGGSNTAAFAGQLDDGRIYNRALDPAEVRRLAQGPAAVPPPTPINPLRLQPAELTYERLPPAPIEINTTPPPARLDPGTLPDYPGLATTHATHDFTPTPSTLSAPAHSNQSLGAWDAMWQPLELWDQLAGYFDRTGTTPVDDAEASETATADVDVNEPPLR